MKAVNKIRVVFYFGLVALAASGIFLSYKAQGSEPHQYMIVKADGETVVRVDNEDMLRLSYEEGDVVWSGRNVPGVGRIWCVLQIIGRFDEEAETWKYYWNNKILRVFHSREHWIETRERWKGDPKVRFLNAFPSHVKMLKRQYPEHDIVVCFAPPEDIRAALGNPVIKIAE